MFCSKCGEYLRDGQTWCANCERSGAGSSKTVGNRYYCKRCKRHLRSKLCAIHGMEATVLMGEENPRPAVKETGVRTAREYVAGQQQKTPRSLPGPKKRERKPLTEAPRKTAQADTYADRIFKEDIELPKVEVPRRPKSADRPAPAATRTSQSKPAPRPRRPAKATGSLRSMIESTLDSLKTSPRKNQKVKETAPSRPRPRKEIPVNKTPQPKAAKPQRQVKSAPAAVRTRKSPSRSNARRPRSWITSGAVVLILATTGLVFSAMYYPDYLRASLFDRAESSFAAGQYDEALKLYKQFANQFPDEPTALEAEARISKIERIDAITTEQQVELFAKMDKAVTAFNNQHYLTPAHDNAVLHLDAVLALDSGFQPALELQQRIIDYYFQQAGESFDREDYDQVITYYKHILRIRPDDPQVLAEIDHTLKLKNVTAMLDNMSELAETRTELKRLRREKYQLKSQIRQEQRKLSTISHTDEKSAAGTAKQDGASPAIADNSASLESYLGISLGGSETGAGDAAVVEIVEENLIDGGKKQYLHRERPEVPQNIDPGESSMILAECIIGVDGNVEKVTIVSPAENQKLNQLALESFRKFRYRPATYRGNPVRFKSIEVLSF